MQSQSVRHRTLAAGQLAHHASLSVVVLASPGIPSTDVARRLRSATSELDAQLIMVSQHAEPGWQSTLADHGELVRAPSGSTRAEMCDLGMALASGTIVAVKDASDVGDGRWIDAFRAILPRQVHEAELTDVAVMDTMAGARSVLADAAPAHTRDPDLLSFAPAIEMAAAG